MKKLLIATKNTGKIKEIRQILSDVAYQLITLAEAGWEKEIKETGISYEENARMKAQITGEETELLTLGEDSGLEIDALNGWPGIYSARHSNGTDFDRINKILRKLKDIPKEKRTARYKAVVALFIPQSVYPRQIERFLDGVYPEWNRRARNNKGRVFTFEGESEGYIVEKPIGTNGFGYDPIFFNFDLGKTNAEATLKEKNQISHRRRALEKTKSFLLSLQ